MWRKLLEHAELFAVANAPRIPLVARAINRLMMLVVTKTSIKVNARKYYKTEQRLPLPQPQMH
jgi:hypothetical protein